MDIGCVLLLSAGYGLVVKTGISLLKYSSFCLLWHISSQITVLLLLTRVESLIHLSEVCLNADSSLCSRIMAIFPLNLSGRVTLGNSWIIVIIGVTICCIVAICSSIMGHR